MARMHQEKKPVTSPFSVIVDTREQMPWRFTGIKSDKSGEPLIVPVITDKALKSGDYSIAGHEDQVAIERKSHGDLLGSITHDRKRFQNEIDRLNEMEFAAVVIEADWLTLMQGNDRSTVNPKTIMRTIFSWSVRYPRVHWFPMPGRRAAELTTFRILEKYWRHSDQKRC